MNETARERLLQLDDYLNRHDIAAAVALFAEDVVFWEPTYAEPRRGRDALRHQFEGFLALLPDVQFTSLAALAEGPWAFHERRYWATYHGRPVTLRECAALRLDADGRFAEVRVYFDRLTLLQQLGLASDG